MANLKGLEQGWEMTGAGLVLAVTMAAGLLLSGAQAWAQSSPVQPAQTAAERIELLRSQIKAAEDGHEEERLCEHAAGCDSQRIAPIAMMTLVRQHGVQFVLRQHSRGAGRQIHPRS